jgi:hypothetical protein
VEKIEQARRAIEEAGTGGRKWSVASDSIDDGSLLIAFRSSSFFRGRQLRRAAFGAACMHDSRQRWHSVTAATQLEPGHASTVRRTICFGRLV